MKDLIKEMESLANLSDAVTIAAGYFDSKLNMTPNQTYTVVEVQQIFDALFEVHIREIRKRRKKR